MEYKKVSKVPVNIDLVPVLNYLSAYNLQSK